MIEIVDESIVYRNPLPHLRTRHAWHPTIAALGPRRWMCCFDLAEAPEAHDYATYFAVSDDDGQTWSEPRRILAQTTPAQSSSVRMSRLRDGSIVAAGARHDVRDENQGRVNPETFGYCDMTLVLTRFDETTLTWSQARQIEPALRGTQFETCHAIIDAGGGRLLLPTSTWMNWDGSAPHGMRAVILESTDHGQTWPTAIDVMDSWDERVTHFEQSVTQRADGSLVSVSWRLQVDTSTTLPNAYAVAENGRDFGPAAETDLDAQTAKILALPDGRILCVFRKDRVGGLWAGEVTVGPDGWHTDQIVPLWGSARDPIDTTNGAEELRDLRLGFPQLARREDGDIEVVFWTRRDELNEIRRVRLRVS